MTFGHSALLLETVMYVTFLLRFVEYPSRAECLLWNLRLLSRRPVRITRNVRPHFRKISKKLGMIQSLGNKINILPTCHSVDPADPGVRAED